MLLIILLLTCSFSSTKRHRPTRTPPPPPALPVVSITVNAHQKYQTIEGFGISEDFRRAHGIHKHPNSSHILDLLFSDTLGAGLTILRNGIGCYPSNPHHPPLPPPPATYTFSNDSSQIWLSLAAQNYSVNTFYASALSAPWYMKTNANDLDGGCLCCVTGTSCSTGDWRLHFANYLIQYLISYQKAGINISHLGFQNEPNISPSYAGMRSYGSQAVDFLKILVPALKSSGFGNMKVVGQSPNPPSQKSNPRKENNYSTSTPHTDIPRLQQHHSTPRYQSFTSLWDSGSQNTDPDSGEVTINEGTEADGLLYGIEEVVGLCVFWEVCEVRVRSVYVDSSSFWDSIGVSAFESKEVGRSGIKGITVQVLNIEFRNVTVSMLVNGAREGGVVLLVLTNEALDLQASEYLAMREGLLNATVPARSMMSFVFT
ncbi:uncharacterized protein PAC_06322 [Phialocephala subalpina]|uniref:Glycosyl hydrolase family 30 TIM-barrel domain-containing protein n=1 Tax=Phialocephala subalpina TaxID=576137 RepID=A0A1L7WUH7_9HELO|nr:uncharacterized protein PAC_06322 [Phialocephala subalpina]